MRYPAEKVLVLNETETRHENLKETARILAQFLARKVRTFGFGRSLLDLGGKSLRSPVLRRASDAAHGYFAPAQEVLHLRIEFSQVRMGALSLTVGLLILRRTVLSLRAVVLHQRAIEPSLTVGLMLRRVKVLHLRMAVLRLRAEVLTLRVALCNTHIMLRVRTPALRLHARA